jgi:hypothetical protein
MVRQFEQREMRPDPHLHEREPRLRPFVVGVFVGRRLRYELVLYANRANYRRGIDEEANMGTYVNRSVATMANFVSAVKGSRVPPLAQTVH